jgi:hypothetical protein
MNYAPENEMGVVFLFSHLARKLGYEIDLIRPGCPDCVAYRDGKRVRIEFEYRSSNFARHRHDPKKCDFLPAGTHAAGRGQGGDVRQGAPARPVTKPSQRHEEVHRPVQPTSSSRASVSLRQALTARRSRAAY